MSNRDGPLKKVQKIQSTDKVVDIHLIYRLVSVFHLMKTTLRRPDGNVCVVLVTKHLQ